MKRIVKSALGISLLALVFLFAACPPPPGPGPDDGEVKTATEHLEEAYGYLEDEDYDKTIASFEAAYAADPTNNEAIVFSALAKFAKISTDPKVATLIQSKLGLTSYPATMNSLVSGDWLIDDPENIANFPELNVPGWYAETDMYQNSLVGGVQTSSTFAMLLLANALEGNIDGLNGLIDGILDGVFGDSFEAVCARIDELDMSDRIEVPALFVEEFGLDTMFDDSDVTFDYNPTIGKAELQALTSALRLYKSGFQWLASYNFNTDLSFGRFDWSDPEALENMLASLEAKHDPFTNGFLSTRNAGSMAAAKQSFITAVTDILESYNYLISPENEAYPQGVKDKIEPVVAPIKAIVEDVLAALNGNGIFDINITDDPETEVDESLDLSVDLGRFFTAGELSHKNFIDTEDNGQPKLYVVTDDDPLTLSLLDANDIATLTDENPDNDVVAGIKVKDDNYWLDLFMTQLNSDPEDFSFIPLPATVIVPLYEFYN
ncbi:MAG: hypothetical protein LBV20_02680 [Treponema sp.]|jgi:hypothetical protein|nr:hypothetical protein [Treponema sp.]